MIIGACSYSPTYPKFSGKPLTAGAGQRLVYMLDEMKIERLRTVTAHDLNKNLFQSRHNSEDIEEIRLQVYNRRREEESTLLQRSSSRPADNWGGSQGSLPTGAEVGTINPQEIFHSGLSEAIGHTSIAPASSSLGTLWRPSQDYGASLAARTPSFYTPTPQNPRSSGLSYTMGYNTSTVPTIASSSSAIPGQANPGYLRNPQAATSPHAIACTTSEISSGNPQAGGSSLRQPNNSPDEVRTEWEHLNPSAPAAHGEASFHSNLWRLANPNDVARALHDFNTASQSIASWLVKNQGTVRLKTPSNAQSGQRPSKHTFNFNRDQPKGKGLAPSFKITSEEVELSSKKSNRGRSGAGTRARNYYLMTSLPQETASSPSFIISPRRASGAEGTALEGATSIQHAEPANVLRHDSPAPPTPPISPTGSRAGALAAADRGGRDKRNDEQLAADIQNTRTPEQKRISARVIRELREQQEENLARAASHRQQPEDTQERPASRASNASVFTNDSVDLLMLQNPRSTQGGQCLESNDDYYDRLDGLRPLDRPVPRRGVERHLHRQIERWNEAQAQHRLYGSADVGRTAQDFGSLPQTSSSNQLHINPDEQADWNAYLSSNNPSPSRAHQDSRSNSAQSSSLRGCLKSLIWAVVA